jgi:hypothetical protein
VTDTQRRRQQTRSRRAIEQLTAEANSREKYGSKSKPQAGESAGTRTRETEPDQSQERTAAAGADRQGERLLRPGKSTNGTERNTQDEENRGGGRIRSAREPAATRAAHSDAQKKL